MHGTTSGDVSSARPPGHPRGDQEPYASGSLTKPLTVVLALLLAVYAGILAAPTDPFTPDEFAHYDYLSVIAQESRVPAQLSTARSQTADIFACTPLSEGTFLVCGSQGQDPRMLPWLGENSATVNLPFFYAVDAVGSALLSSWMDTDLLTGARAMAILWTLLLCAFTALLARQLGASPLSAAIAAGVVGLSPVVLIGAAAVQTDTPSAALAVGAVVAWLGLRCRPIQLRLAISLPLGLAATTIRPTGLLAIVTILLLERYVARSSRNGTLVVIGLATVGTWVGLAAADAAIRGGPPSNGLLNTYVSQNWNQRSVDAVIEAWASIPMVLNWPFLSNPIRPASSVLGLASIVVTVGAIIMAWRSREPAARVIGRVSIAGLFVLPVLLIAVLLLMGQALFYQPRYLLLPVVLCVGVAASHLSTKTERLVTVGLGLSAAVVAFGVVALY